MAERNPNRAGELLIERLPASGGMPYEELYNGLTSEGETIALQQVQPLKRDKRLQTWYQVDAQGNKVHMIGRYGQKPS